MTAGRNRISSADRAAARAAAEASRQAAQREERHAYARELAAQAGPLAPEAIEEAARILAALPPGDYADTG